jgi:YVTN family beta-propeller protein
MRASGLIRALTLGIGILAPIVLGSATAERTVAGDEPDVTFSPTTIEVLDGSSTTVTVTIYKQISQEEIDAGHLSVSLIVPEVGSDPLIEVKEGDIPQGAKAGSFQTITVSFNLECKDKKIVGAGEQSADLAIALEEGDEFGAASATCTEEIAVNFAPDPLEIEDESSAEVTVSINKTVTASEVQLGYISIELVDVDSTFDGDDTLGTADVAIGAKKAGKKVRVSHTFTLKCKKMEVQGKDGESTEGESQVILAVELPPANVNHGTGEALCIEKVGAAIPSHGTMPADIIVDETAGLFYVLNAGGAGIDVFTTTGAYQETLVLCEDQALTTIQPALLLPPCGEFQGLGAWYAAQILRKIFVSDFQRGIMLIYDVQTRTVTEKDVLSGPRDVATDPLTGYVYVANFNLGTVTVIDGLTEETVDEISTSGGPNGLAIDEVDGLLYVSDFVNDRVVVIDLASGEVLDMIAVGPGPDGIRVDEDGYVWVSNYGDGSVTVLPPYFGGSASAQGDAETIQVGGEAQALAINPLTDHVFVANYGDDTVSVIDRLSREVTATLDVGDGPASVAVSPVAGMVYVGNHNDDTISPISDTAPVATQALLWGDDDCNARVDAVDALKNLQDVAALPYEQTEPCFGLDEEIGVPLALAGDQLWGDVDCDGDVDAVDALAILRWIAGLDVTVVEPCPGVGDEVALHAQGVG